MTHETFYWIGILAVICVVIKIIRIVWAWIDKVNLLLYRLTTHEDGLRTRINDPENRARILDREAK